jgi:hypothetical protein
MLTLILEPNRSSTSVFAVHVAHVRVSGLVQRIERRFRAVGGRWVCVSSRSVPWTRKEWCDAPNGERDKHGRRHTIKRDWLRCHAGLHEDRMMTAAEGRAL